MIWVVLLHHSSGKLGDETAASHLLNALKSNTPSLNKTFYSLSLHIDVGHGPFHTWHTETPY